MMQQKVTHAIAMIVQIVPAVVQLAVGGALLWWSWSVLHPYVRGIGAFLFRYVALLLGSR
jgi:hypothetical protein